MDKKTICIFSALFSPSMGGVETYTMNLARELTRKGHSVIVVTSQIDASPFKTIEHEVEVIRLPALPLMHGRFPFPKIGTEHNKLTQELIERDIDHILINTRLYPLSLLAVRVAEKKSIKPILLDHGSAYITAGDPVLDKVLQAYERIMTHILKKHSMDFYGISHASVEWLGKLGIHAVGVLPNAIDSVSFVKNSSTGNFRAELGLSADSFIVAFIGRLVPEKGVREILEAAELLQDRNDIHFIFAGEGSLRNLFEASGENVHLVGKISQNDVGSLLQQTSLLCLPSRSEGFCTTLLEAAACSCPFITTDIGGARELLGSAEHPFLLPSSEPKAIAAKIEELHSDYKLALSLAADISQKASVEYSWEIVSEKVLK